MVEFVLVYSELLLNLSHCKYCICFTLAYPHCISSHDTRCLNLFLKTHRKRSRYSVLIIFIVEYKPHSKGSSFPLYVGTIVLSLLVRSLRGLCCYRYLSSILNLPRQLPSSSLLLRMGLRMPFHSALVANLSLLPVFSTTTWTLSLSTVYSIVQ
jgi:hypothetical protein